MLTVARANYIITIHGQWGLSGADTHSREARKYAKFEGREIRGVFAGVREVAFTTLLQEGVQISPAALSEMRPP